MLSRTARMLSTGQKTFVRGHVLRRRAETMQGSTSAKAFVHCVCQTVRQALQGHVWATPFNDGGFPRGFPVSPSTCSAFSPLSQERRYLPTAGLLTTCWKSFPPPPVDPVEQRFIYDALCEWLRDVVVSTPSQEPCRPPLPPASSTIHHF